MNKRILYQLFRSITLLRLARPQSHLSDYLASFIIRFLYPTYSTVILLFHSMTVFLLSDILLVSYARFITYEHHLLDDLNRYNTIIHIRAQSFCSTTFLQQLPDHSVNIFIRKLFSRNILNFTSSEERSSHDSEGRTLLIKLG